MSFVLTALTEANSSIHNPIIWVIDSSKADTPLTYPNFKYVLDIYIDGNLVQRLKTVPRPTDKLGIFDISPVIRNYISCQLSPLNDFQAMNISDGAFLLSVTVKAGEEYGYTVYPNITDQTAIYYNTYTGQPVNGTPVINAYQNNVASDRPTLSKVRFEDPRFFIPFFNFDLFDTTVKLKVYKKDMSVITDESIILGLGTPEMVVFNCAPSVINAYWDGNDINPATHWGYSLQFVGVNNKVYFFELVCEKIHTPYLIHFFNQYGGYETVPFRKLSRKTEDITRKTYSQKNYEVVTKMGVTSLVFSENNVVNNPQPTYATNYREKLRVTTDLLTDAEYTWLRQLVVSPEVYLEKDGYMYPVTITNTNYEERKYVNDRFTSLSLDLEFGMTLNAQYK
jgi:hypothetical protein